MNRFYFHEDEVMASGASEGNAPVTPEAAQGPLNGEVTAFAQSEDAPTVPPMESAHGAESAPEAWFDTEPFSQPRTAQPSEIGAEASFASAEGEMGTEQPSEPHEDRPEVGGHYAPEGTVPTLGDGDAVLSVRNLYKGYRRDHFVLDNFSLDIAKGQIVGILGPNGCGKTTLLKMIA